MRQRRSKRADRIPTPDSAPVKKSVITPRMAAFLILAIYLALLAFAHGRVPPALNNDVAEKALRGVYLVKGHHMEVMTFSVGNSAETLYLYLVGATAWLFGPTLLSIQLVSWTCALTCIWLLWKLTERIDPTVPAWVPVLVGASSVWLFHYAMSGLRAIATPVFLGIFALLLDRVEEGANRKVALVCGAVLGLSIYAYTSARVLPIAFVLYGAARLIRHRKDKAVLLARYGTIAAGAFLASIPNLIFAAQHPKDFFSRGNYVVMGGLGSRVFHTLWSIFFPFFYPDFYRRAGSFAYNFSFDAVASGLTVTGANPVHWIIAAAILIGIWRVRIYLGRPVMAFFVSAWVATMLSLGWTGPSPTRMLILWPVDFTLAALGFGFLLSWRPSLRIGVVAAILAAGTLSGYKYVANNGSAEDLAEYALDFNPAATAIGETASALPKNERVLCVISRDLNVVKYLTSAAPATVRIEEFHRRPFAPSLLPMTEFKPSLMLIENFPDFDILNKRLRADWLVAHNDYYYELRLPSQ